MTIQELKKRYGIQYEGRFICPICGIHKAHYRLYGYRCHNPEHHEMEEDFNRALIDAVHSGKLSQDEYDQYCFGDMR